MKKKLIGFFVCMLLIAAVVLPVTGTMSKMENEKSILLNDNTSMEFVPGELIVKLKKDATFLKSSLTGLNEKSQVYTYEKLFLNTESTILDDIYLLHVPMYADILSIVRQYESYPDIVYAEPNWRAYPCSIPNDENFSNQWYLHNTGQVFLNWEGVNYSGTPDADIDAPEAWDIETGSPDMVIAIVDSGIDYSHPDLAANIWNNIDEIPGNGIDDDNNGYIDDIRAWDFYYNDNNVTDGNGHGTMCAGVAGAVGNNGIGIAGVAWNCKVMPIRIANESWYTNAVIIAKGIRYAADNGANVISMSFGVRSILIEDALNYAYGKGLFLCAAAGNSDKGVKFYPAAYENVTAIAMTNQNDNRCSQEDWGPGWGSNYGDWVDIAAPGNLIYSTIPTWAYYSYYDWSSGTSFASPMVAGVAALLLSKDPSLTPDEMKGLLCGNVDPYISQYYIGTGRLNAYKALLGLQLKEGIQLKGGLGVNIEITNSGTLDVTDATWKIHVEGGILGSINKTVNGTVDIKAGESQTVSTGILLGFGSISIDAQVAGIEKIATGTQLFIYSMVK